MIIIEPPRLLVFVVRGGELFELPLRALLRIFYLDADLG